MGKAPLGIEKAREERINSNTERMKQLGILTLSRDVNGLHKKKTDSTTKRRIEMSTEEEGVVGEGSSPRNHSDMDIEEYNPLTSDESSSEEVEPQKKKKEKGKTTCGMSGEEQSVNGEGSSQQNHSGANTRMNIEEFNPLTSSDESSEEETPQKKTRGRTTCAKLAKKNGLYIKFNRHGHPKGKWLSQYKTHLATVSKERFPITITNWKKVDENLKEECWEEIKQLWGINKDTGFKHAKKRMNSAWKNFKSDLVNDYMREGKDPFSKYTWINSEIWEEFVRQKSTPEFAKLSETNRELCKRNDNPHRLGSRGYDVKKRVWKKKIKAKSEDVTPILDIKDPRCQFYVLGRMVKKPNGTLEAPPKTQALIETIKDNQQKVDSGEIEASGSSDVLTLSLGNPEHSGRTRGLGAHVTWKQGLNAPRALRKRGVNQADMKAFAEEIKRQCYADMREEMKEQMKEQLLEQVKDMRVSLLAELKVQQAEPDQYSPEFRRSSQHSNIVTSPLDSIQVISPCYLTCKVGEEHIKMANAMVWPRKKDEQIHCVPLLEDHMKVQVDSAVDDIYLKFTLPTKINKDFVKIEDTLGSFIQWPKDSIILDECIDQDVSMPTESASKEFEKSMHREALISKKMLAKVGPEFEAIHERVMKEPLEKNGFLLSIKEGLLLPQSTLINLGFNDLKDLVKQDKLDVSILSIWVIYMKICVTDLGREADVGFLDPSRISQSLFRSESSSAASSYLLESLNNMQDKKFILAPYFEFEHWVLLVFVMHDNKVYVIDSLEPKEPNYEIMVPFIDIFESYVESGGVHKEGSTQCVWQFIKSPRQKGGKVCGFYVMKHMQDLVTTQFDIFPNCDLPTEKYTPTQLHAITRQWCTFFLDNF